MSLQHLHPSAAQRRKACCGAQGLVHLLVGHLCSSQAVALGTQPHKPWGWVFWESKSSPEPEHVPIGTAAEGMEGAGCPSSIWASWLSGTLLVRVVGSSCGWARVSWLVREAAVLPICSCSSAWTTAKNPLCPPWGGFAR